jgi:hypothetical protein
MFNLLGLSRLIFLELAVFPIKPNTFAGLRRLSTAILIVGMSLPLTVLGSAIAWAQTSSDRSIVVLQPLKNQRVSTDRRVALVIGNGAYQSVSPLANPPNDATDVANALRGLGFEVILETNADLPTMGSALNRFSDLLAQGNVGLFYYAGHGVQFEGQNYLMPVDAALRDERDLDYNALSLDKVFREMARAGNEVNLVILDACRNNPFPQQSRASSGGLATPGNAASGVLIAYATAPGAVAADGEGRNGTFTAALLEHLAEPGLEVEQMLKRVRATVKEKTQDRQVPWTSSSLVGEFAFNPEGAETAPTLVAVRPDAASPVRSATQGETTLPKVAPPVQVPSPESGTSPESLAESVTVSSRSLSDEVIPISTESRRGDRYPLQGRAGQSIEVRVESSEFDPYLILQTDRGEKIAEDDDSGTGSNSLLTATLPQAGTYEVIVSSYEEGSTGAYEVSIDGRKQRGVLSATAPVVETVNVKRGDRYGFEGRTGQEIEISLESTDFDPYVILQNAAGETIAENDDSLNSYNSVLNLTLPDTGRYELLATSYSNGSAGSYDLKVHATEPVNPPLLSTGAQLDLTERVVTQTRISPGNRIPLKGTADQVLNISLDSTDFDTYLILQDQNGEVIGESDDREGSTNSLLQVTLPKTGTYDLVASAFAADSAGSYQLQATEQQRSATPRLNTSGTWTPEATPTEIRYVRNADAYTFSGEAGQIVEIGLDSEEFDPYLTLEKLGAGDLGETIAENDDSGTDRNALLNIALPETGTYRVFARGYEDSSAGAYQFQINGLSLVPSPLLQEQGSITDQDPVIPVPDSTKRGDQYSLNGQAGQRLEINLTSPEFDTYLILQDAEGNTIAENDDRMPGDGNSRLTAQLPTTGTYQVIVTGFSEDSRGLYDLKAQEARVAKTIQPLTRDRLEPSERLVTNTTVRKGDPYTIQGRAGETIEARMNSEALDSYLVLQNDRGELIAENDDGDGRNAVLSAVLPSDGTYTLLATAYGEDGVGTYTLTAEEVQIQERPVLNTSGQLNSQSETVTSRYFRQGKAYTFSGQAGQTFLIQLDSTDFDTYLILQNDRGETLTQDDDGGEEGSNSALRFTLPETGTYRVVVTPFNEGYSGAYTLKVSGQRLITPAIVEVTGKLGD